MLDAAGAACHAIRSLGKPPMAKAPHNSATKPARQRSMPLAPVVARLIGRELRMVASLPSMFAGRAPRPPAGATAVPYGRDLRSLLKVLIALSILEIVVVAIVVELLVSSEIVRYGQLIVTVYGVLWAYGFAASIRRNPHIVGPQQLRLRFGMLTDVGLSTRLIASASRPPGVPTSGSSTSTTTACRSRRWARRTSSPSWRSPTPSISDDTAFTPCGGCASRPTTRARPCGRCALRSRRLATPPSIDSRLRASIASRPPRAAAERPSSETH
jgi:hypothetical protein